MALAYPLQLGLAYLLMAGYLMRTLFVSMNLPGAVGVLFAGWMFTFFMQPGILDGRDDFQECAFFLVLLTAGFEISMDNLTLPNVAIGLLPSSCELAGLALYAWKFFGYGPIQSLVLGTVLAGLADGIVIPKMMEFEERADKEGGLRRPMHRLTRLVLIAAPMEASWVLTLFGLLSAFAEQSNSDTAPAMLVLANILRVIATLVVGSFMGYACSLLVQQREWLAKDDGCCKIAFTNKPVEAYLLVLAVALAAFSLGQEKVGSEPLVPIGFAPGSLFQSELLVIVLGSSFNRATRPDGLDLHPIVGGVWVFGQIFLFSMIGSKIDASVLRNTLRVAPVLLFGLCCRFLGVVLAVHLAHTRKDDSGDLQRKDVRKEILFVFLSSLPRASLQGALGFVPIKERFFGGGPEARSACLFIADSARLYIMIMSLVGSTLLHRLGPVLLAEEHAAKERRRRDDEAWRRRTSGLLGPRNQLRQHQSRDPIFGQNRLFSDKTPEDPEDDEERGRRVLVTFEAGGLPKQDEPVQLKEMKDARRAGGSECTKKLLSERSASFPVIQSSTAGSAPGVLLPVSVNEETQQEERKEEEKVEKEGGFIRRPERTAKTSSGFLRHGTLEELTLDTDFQSALRTIQTVYGISGGSGPSSDELVKYLDDKYSAPVRVQMTELDDIGPMTSKFRSLHQF